jgi:hypothetical protein
MVFENSEDARFGSTLDSLMLRRDRAAQHEGSHFGTNHVFKELGERVLMEVAPNMRVLEVDAATGVLTRLLLARGASVTALEPSGVFVKNFLNTIEDSRLTVVEGFTEELDKDESFDLALISFPSRRGIGLLNLINEVKPFVKGRILVVMPDDGSLDWAYLTRGTALEGYDIGVRFLTEHEDRDDPLKTASSKATSREGATQASCPYLPQDIDMIRRAVLLYMTEEHPLRPIKASEAWALAARTITVPYPVPRGAATRLLRYFVAGGDRAVLITTDPRGLTRLYGNLRTATHRIARDEVTVRRVEGGIQLLLIPRAEHEG